MNARSFLFVPASRPERIVKALASPADAVVIDLEDAVALDQKDAAREALAAVWAALDMRDRSRVMVRINGVGTAWFDDDCALLRSLSSQGLAGAMVPKAESASALRRVSESTGLSVLVPLIESAEGLHAVDLLARATGVVRMAFGHLDFQVDMGMSCGPDEVELASVRLALVLTSRRAGLAPPVDGVTVNLESEACLAADASRSQRFGFGAKLCIHPKQVATVHQAFAGNPEQLAWARRVLEASRAHRGAFVFDGKMVDAPVLQFAKRLLGDRLIQH